MGFDNSVGDREPQSGALAHTLGCKERLKDSRFNIGRHPCAGIFNFRDQEVAVDVSLERDGPALRHGVPRVVQQAEKNLMEMTGAAMTVGEFGIESPFNLNVLFGIGLIDQLDDFGNDMVERGFLETERAFSAKDEQASDQFSNP